MFKACTVPTAFGETKPGRDIVEAGKNSKLFGGLLANAALITAIGFILSCTLCYLLAVQGLRRAAGQAGANSPRAWATDVFTGAVISAPVYWMFTQFLGINLPGLTSTGWL